MASADRLPEQRPITLTMEGFNALLQKDHEQAITILDRLGVNEPDLRREFLAFQSQTAIDHRVQQVVRGKILLQREML